ncbi:glycine zipper 2TM domain-containing protein [Asticcacaulis sp. BYS171W]|uniref:17 kDa surface antigen n=1 Tax=Asticcacaulis aquaticus TaxID=2984212 RepID=A0ABT5HXC4_9CAUL|nr:glycine zipper 2TM domain-containing protein [Asticcacaulis aquaticus]MDC7684694.1 glycine zipper 2TM domain-containing protein [Asticcacaulis aquaticus]
MITSTQKSIAAGFGLAVMAAALMVSAPASAQGRYDGFCYEKEQNTKTKGTIIGAVAGGALGNVVAGKGNKTEGTVAGAVVGGIIGNQIGEHEKEKAVRQCLNDQYYVFDGREYAPPPAPKGYRVSYYNAGERPAYGTYYTHRNGKVQKWTPPKKHKH